LLTDLGLKASKNFDLGGGALISPNVSAAWEHVYQGSQDSLTANLGGDDSTFTSNGPALGTDGAAVGAGLDFHVQGFNAFVDYQGKLAINNYSSNGFAAGVNVGF
jgi:outer membrane autotransporter protein